MDFALCVLSLPDAGDAGWFLYTPTGNAPNLARGMGQRYDARRTGSALDFDLELLGTPLHGQPIVFQVDGGTPNGFALLAFAFAPARTDFGPLGIAGIVSGIDIRRLVPNRGRGARIESFNRMGSKRNTAWGSVVMAGQAECVIVRGW